MALLSFGRDVRNSRTSHDKADRETERHLFIRTEWSIPHTKLYARHPYWVTILVCVFAIGASFCATMLFASSC